MPAQLAKYLPLSKWDLPADLKKTQEGDVVHNPKISGLLRARIRKAALLATAAGDTSNVWNPEWDRPLVAKALRVPKSTIGRDAKVAERFVCSQLTLRKKVNEGGRLCAFNVKTGLLAPF